jgi:hypothetical protein
VDRSFDRNSGPAMVKDAFEIKAAHEAAHEPGLVVVLDRVVNPQPVNLTGKTALIRTPSGNLLHVRIDEAKDHIAATSLFFRNLNPGNVPVGSAVEISDEGTPPGS